MYIGRFLVVTPGMAAYRVSSRSFPDRRIVKRDEALSVVPTAEAKPTDNPYVAYNCLRLGDDAATIGNGSHVDPIAEKIALGFPVRDALVTGLHAMDYEKDAYDTPRIAAVTTEADAFVGIVRSDALIVEQVEDPTLIATYELDAPTSFDDSWSNAEDAARGVYEYEYEHPVCAAAVNCRAGSYELGIYNGPDTT